MTRARRHADDLRGVTRLAAEATRGIAEVVEAMHRTIAAGPALLGRPLKRPARVVTRVAYAPLHHVTAWVAGGLDRALERLAPLLGESVPGDEREAIAAVLNGVLGDYLEATGNPLAIAMTLRAGAGDRQALASTGRLLVLVHGSSMNDRQWVRHGHDHGAAIARDLGYAPLYLHYNSGRHVAVNGRELALLLESTARAWPVPVTEIVLLGHSMGGLVARSACVVAEQDDLGWRRQLRALVCLGTPHHGAPLERGGNWIDVLLGVHPYSAPLARLGKIRSAGVTDMRYGATTLPAGSARGDRFALRPDGRAAVPLPGGVATFAVAATLSPEPSPEAVTPARLRSDGLVPVASALGDHARAELALGFAPDHRFTAYAAGHLDLLDRADVYATVRDWLAGLDRTLS